MTTSFMCGINFSSPTSSSITIAWQRLFLISVDGSLARPKSATRKASMFCERGGGVGGARVEREEERTACTPVTCVTSDGGEVVGRMCRCAPRVAADDERRTHAEGPDPDDASVTWRVPLRVRPRMVRRPLGRPSRRRTCFSGSGSSRMKWLVQPTA